MRDRKAETPERAKKIRQKSIAPRAASQQDAARNLKTEKILTFRAIKNGVFILEGLNGFAVSIYFNYLFFFLSAEFNFGNRGNLLFCGANGLLYTFASYFAGKFAQRAGYFRALQIGYGIVIAGLCVAFASGSVAFHLLAMMIWTLGICFTWPSLEALTCEGESEKTLPGKIGMYNIVWSGALAFGFFVGGAMKDTFGWRSIFVVPAFVHLLQIIVVRHLSVSAHPKWHELPGCPEPTTGAKSNSEKRAEGSAFLKMAWLANPFAYIAMNTVVPLIPNVAERLGLSATGAGFFCSIWMFARMASFGLLWKWTAWHYKFNWLVSSFVILIVTFAGILLLSNIWMLVAAQILFGWAVGLIYYSSLFYSMDASDSKGEHGGIHEAAIGAGIFGGPAIGLAALHLFPKAANPSVWAVAAILTMALPALFWLRRK